MNSVPHDDDEAPSEADIERIDAELARVGRETVQAFRLAHGMVAQPLSNVRYFAKFDEAMERHLIVRMALCGRND